jgi:hypothetical protein
MGIALEVFNPRDFDLVVGAGEVWAVTYQDRVVERPDFIHCRTGAETDYFSVAYHRGGDSRNMLTHRVVPGRRVYVGFGVDDAPRFAGRIRGLRRLKRSAAFSSRAPIPDRRCHSTNEPTRPIHAARRVIAPEGGKSQSAVSARDIDLRKATSRQSPNIRPIGLVERIGGRPTAKARAGTSKARATHRRRA